MPGYILYEDPEDPLCTDPKRQNDFYIGNLLPDTVTSRAAKAVSHFRDPAYKECMMEWPHPDRFIEKYRDRMGEAVYRGYLFHLYIDRCFFRDYIPEVAGFYDAHGKGTEIRDEIAEVRLKKSGACVPLKRYLSEEYYYGDYTACRQNWKQELIRGSRKRIMQGSAVSLLSWNGSDRVRKARRRI